MVITLDTLMELSAGLAAVGSLGGVLLGLYKLLENNKRQNEVIKQMQDEQTLLCYAMKGALQGLIESGCNGPCKDALARLDKHLNKSAHHPDL